MNEDARKRQAEEQELSQIRAMLKAMPTSYAERFAAIRDLRARFQSEIALALKDSVNEYAQQIGLQPPKQQIESVAHLGYDMHRLGLALRDPDGGAADLVVDPDFRREDGKRGGFKLRTRDDPSSVETRLASDSVPELVLMDEPFDPRSIDRWRNLSAPRGASR